MRSRFGFAALALMVAMVGCRDREPNTPIAIVFTPLGDGGVVLITYSLRNPDSVFIDIDPAFVRAGSAVPVAATAAPGGEGTRLLEANPGVAVHTFLWDALTDLGPGRHDVRFRVSPRLGSHVGQIGQTGTFTVLNDDLTLRLADLSRPRTGHAASELPSGGVLVTGGAGIAPTVEAIEAGPDAEGGMALGIALAAPLPSPREDHAQVLALLDAAGTLAPVIFGGQGALGTLDDVRFYDAATDTWTPLPPLPAPRRGMTATRLEDGSRVLLAGGVGDAGPLFDDLVYDVATATLGASPSVALTVATGGVTVGRLGHTATLLPSGEVLIAGGTDPSGAVLDTTAIFDPTTLLYRVGPPLDRPRERHAAALLGASPDLLATPTLVLFGGRDDLGTTDPTDDVLLGTACRVDVEPTIGAAFSVITAFLGGATATLAVPRLDITALVLGHTDVSLEGGFDGTRASSRLERFDLRLGLIRPARESLAIARRAPRATAFGAGRALITGSGTAAVELFIDRTGSGAQAVTPDVATFTGRAEHQATVMRDGRVLITGGTDGVVEGGVLRALDTAEVYDPAARADARVTATTGSLLFARRDHAAAALADGRTVVAGGLDATGARLASIEVFAPATGTFTSAGVTLPVGLSGLGAASIAAPTGAGKVLLIGGRSDTGPSALCFIFDPAGPSLDAADDLEDARAGFAVAVLADGRIVAAGGIGAGDAPLASVEIYDPAADAWETVTVGDFGVARSAIASAVLTSGLVMLAGGRDAAGDPVRDVCLLDARATPTLTLGADLLMPRAGAVVVPVAGGAALVAGGATARVPSALAEVIAIRTASIERYDVATNTSAPASDPDLSNAVEGARAARLRAGGTLLIGGRSSTGAVRAGADRIAP